ncbi:MAG: methyltransferase domain-containing protein [Abditibacteriales bacterium]|nr:methyltransferase domain-containing protein [Abditibacteriales bacterium]
MSRNSYNLHSGGNDNYTERVREHHRQIRGVLQPGGRMYEWKLQLALQLVTPQDVVLDAGCGNGLFTIPLSAHAREVYGVDFTAELLDDLKAHLPTCPPANLQLIQGDLRCLPFPDAFFDSLVCYSTLYYIRELDRVLSEFCRVLKRGGRAIFDLGNIHSLEARHSLRSYRVPHHFVTVRAAKQLIQRAGLHLVRLRRLQVFRPLRGHPIERWLMRLLEAPVGKTMLDEYVSALPLLRHFAFRLVFVCENGQRIAVAD